MKATNLPHLHQPSRPSLRLKHNSLSQNVIVKACAPKMLCVPFWTGGSTWLSNFHGVTGSPHRTLIGGPARPRASIATQTWTWMDLQEIALFGYGKATKHTANEYGPFQGLIRSIRSFPICSLTFRVLKHRRLAIFREPGGCRELRRACWNSFHLSCYHYDSMVSSHSPKHFFLFTVGSLNSLAVTVPSNISYIYIYTLSHLGALNLNLKSL